MRYVRSVDRAIDLLERIAAATRPQRLQQLSGLVKAPKSTTLNILRTLNRRGAIDFENTTKAYSLGPLLREISRNTGGAANLVQRARKGMLELVQETGETVMLIREEAAETTILELIKSPKVIQYNAEVGARRPLYCTSAGKLMLSLKSASQLDDYLAQQPLKKRARKTVTSRAKLISEIRTIRRQGFAVSDSEFAEDLFGISAPIIRGSNGEFVAALCIAGPTYRMRGKLTSLQLILRQRAGDISDQLDT